MRTFDKYTDFFTKLDQSHTNIKYENIGLDSKTDNTLIVVHNLLTETECENLVRASNGKYKKLDTEYTTNERDSYRLLNLDESMANILYLRIKNIIMEEHKKSQLKPFGFGTDGKWEPVGINKCFRYSSYTAPSNGFKAHRDGAYVENVDLRSVLTLIIYLTDDFIGGQTNFLSANKERIKGQIVSEELDEGFDTIYSFKPVIGSALIFNHNVIHQGLPIMAGTKYIIRSDILFRRTDLSTDLSWKLDPDFLEAIELYREAMNQEMEGNIDLSSVLYSKALALRQFH